MILAPRSRVIPLIPCNVDAPTRCQPYRLGRPLHAAALSPRFRARTNSKTRKAKTITRRQSPLRSVRCCEKRDVEVRWVVGCWLEQASLVSFFNCAPTCFCSWKAGLPSTAGAVEEGLRERERKKRERGKGNASECLGNVWVCAPARARSAASAFGCVGREGVRAAILLLLLS